MRQALEVEAEILKLARLLGCEAERLSYLERVPAGDIRALREQVTEMLFTAHEGTLRRLAAASGLLPVALVASIGQRAFGSILSARIAGMLEPARAVEIAARLPTSFLADVAVELDPRRASDVITGMPPRRITEVTRELACRGEYVTMGRFVGHLGDGALVAALAALDDHALLQTAFVMEEKHRLDEVVALLGERRVRGLVEAAEAAGVWSDLTELLSEPRRRPAVASR
jgi:hypothetical protein